MDFIEIHKLKKKETKDFMQFRNLCRKSCKYYKGSGITLEDSVIRNLILSHL